MKTLIIFALLIAVVVSTGSTDDATPKKCTTPPEIPKPNNKNRFDKSEFLDNSKTHVEYKERLKEYFRKSQSTGKTIKDLENEIREIKTKIYNNADVDITKEIQEKKIWSDGFILANYERTRLAELYYLDEKNKNTIASH